MGYLYLFTGNSPGGSTGSRGRSLRVCDRSLLLDQWSGTSGILLRAFFIGFILFIDRLFYSLLDILSRHSHIDFRQKGSFSSRFYLFHFIDFISFIYFTLPAYQTTCEIRHVPLTVFAGT